MTRTLTHQTRKSHAFPQDKLVQRSLHSWQEDPSRHMDQEAEGAGCNDNVQAEFAIVEGISPVWTTAANAHR